MQLAGDLLRNGLRGRKDRTGQPNAMAARGFLRAIWAGVTLPRQEYSRIMLTGQVDRWWIITPWLLLIIQ